MIPKNQWKSYLQDNFFDSYDNDDDEDENEKKPQIKIDNTHNYVSMGLPGQPKSYYRIKELIEEHQKIKNQ